MNDILDVFREQQALLEGHFQLSSGMHSSRYIQCARVLMVPRIAERLCAELKSKWTGEKPDMIVGPALGGVVVAHEVARQFDVPGIFVERENQRFAVRRGFSIPPGTKVIVTEDVVTTGGSAAEVIDLLKSIGARPIGVMSLIARTESNPFPVPFVSLATVVPPMWTSTQCPLCVSGSVAVKPGSRPATAGAGP